MRNDQAVQDAARALFEGVAPERKSELEQLWNEHSPRFNLLEDFSQDGSFVLEAGCYRDVHFNHRVMRAFWVASFAAWEGYSAVADGVTQGKLDLALFQELIDCVRQILSAPDSETVRLPKDIPEPGHLPDRIQQPMLRAAAELAHFAIGWALLHEVRHIIHQRKGTSAGMHGSREAKHAEELSCDSFATQFLLDRVTDFAVETGQDAVLVKQKRELGIYFAFFAIAVFANDNWGDSDTHPSVQQRIDATISTIGNSLDTALGIAYLAFFALNTLWPDAPHLSVAT